MGYIAIENGHLYSWFTVPIKNGWIFHSDVNVTRGYNTPNRNKLAGGLEHGFYDFP